MKYNIAEFNKAVAHYKKSLGKMLKKGNACLVEMPLGNEEALYSIAPLSRAVHELHAELNVFVIDRKSESLNALKRTWAVYSDRDSGKKRALLDFIESVKKKAKNKGFEKIFAPPELLVRASRNCFIADGRKIEFRTNWFRRRKWNRLLATCKRILEQGYTLKKNERFSISFELIPSKKDLLLPLDDYLDNFPMAYAMALAAKKKCRQVSLGSSTTRMSQLEPMYRISDLAATLRGCEYEKNINEPWFRKFRKLSKMMHYERMKHSDAALGIHGRGYGGKHFFGLNIGYPTPNRKSRWQSPGQMFLKPFWVAQTRVDSRPPKMRYAMTETLPLENFIRTCYIDFYKLREKDERIRAILKQGKTLYIRGRQLKQGRTELKLDLGRVLRRKSPVLCSDIEVNTTTPREAADIFKINHGRYGNFPGGEVFWTPYDLNGTYMGDVVINIDQSYVIGNQKPLVVKIEHGHYKVKSGPRHIVNALRKRKKESWEMIKLYEKSGSLPKSIINSYKKNFDMVGEIAINTNPKARLSRYLIEAEKIAKMMHIALGSGYEPGRETLYHCDIVLNCPRQKVDIWAITPARSRAWIMRKGNLVV